MNLNEQFADTSAQTTDVSLDLQKPELPAEMANAQAYKAELATLPEVKAMTNEINIQDTGTILAFGQKPSEEISKVADSILSGMRSVNQEEATRMLTDLTKLMDKFDIKDFEKMDDDKGFLSKLFNKAHAKLEAMFAKYEDLGKEVDKISTTLKVYQNDIQKTNTDLQHQYAAEVEHYHMLEKYIVAGEIAMKEIDEFDATIDTNTTLTEQDRLMQHQKLAMIKDMLSQRIYDLQTAENVAMQACPMIQTMQMANFNLMRKINSSFIITLPVFKQCMIQAIQLRRQQIQAKSIQQLDEKTNELLLRNAQNTATQSVAIAQMAGSSSIKIETLRSTYETIKNGIEQTKQITEQMAQERQANSAELETLKNDMKSNGFVE